MFWRGFNTGLHSPGLEPYKSLLQDRIFEKIRNKRSHWPGSQPAPRLYNRNNLCPCARPAYVGECGQGPEFKSARDRHGRNPRRRRNYRERSNINQCTDGLSATQIGKGAPESFNPYQESFPSSARAARLTTTQLAFSNGQNSILDISSPQYQSVGLFCFSTLMFSSV